MYVQIVCQKLGTPEAPVERRSNLFIRHFNHEFFKLGLFYMDEPCFACLLACLASFGLISSNFEEMGGATQLATPMHDI